MAALARLDSSSLRVGAAECLFESMRSLFQLSVQKAAGIAALGTAIACYPRLALWLNRPGPLWTVWLILLWSAFMLWAFVFAWHEKYTGQKVFVFQIQPALWGVASICGLCGAALLYFTVDPTLRQLAPSEYPHTVAEWGAMTLFALAFDQLCVCFAPLAFFSRLVPKRNIAVVLTVLFGTFVLSLKLNTIPNVPLSLSATIILLRMASSYLSVAFYLRGGALVTWWWILLLHSRHLILLPC